jgi:Mlc titration factor MtfA (ptsG expression regulator)
MLVTPATNRRNRIHAMTIAGLIAAISVAASFYSYSNILLLMLVLPTYWLIRRRTLRRLRIMQRQFPLPWEQILLTHVAFFRALTADEKNRFRQLVKVFLDEVRITGIQTDVDETTRILIAASAVIPVFGFRDWEYPRLGEVLVYPGAFDEKYQTDSTAYRNIVGLTGLRNLSGVMILSKPALLAGFDSPSNKENVGIHEFTHLMEKEEVNHGLPPEVPWQAVKQWVQYVAQELSHPSKNAARFSSYAYTNEHEFLAVLAEYFFKSPEVLQHRDPDLYAMLRAMFHQDTATLLRRTSSRRQRYRRNAPCPCGSGKKFKHCCLRKAADKKITSAA